MNLMGLVLVLTALITRVSFVQGSRPYTFEISSFTYEYDPGIFKVFTIKLVKTKDLTIFNGSYISSIDLDDFSVGLKISEISKMRSQPWTLMDIKLNVCSIIDTAPKVAVMRSIIVDIKRNTHLLPDKCPFKKDKEYYLKNFSFNTELFPAYIPTMKVEVSFDVKHLGGTFFKGNIVVAVVTQNSRNAKGREGH